MQHSHSSCSGHVVDAAYLVWVTLLCEDVSDKSLLHFFLLYQKLPQTLHWQRRVVAGPEMHTTPPPYEHWCSVNHLCQFTGAQQNALENISFFDLGHWR